MISKQLIFIFSLLFAVIGFSQTSNPNIIDKEIPVRTGSDIIDFLPPKGAVNETVISDNRKVLYFFENKFYPVNDSEIKQKIDKLNQDDYELNVIGIPEEVSKDLGTIIYIRKKAVK